LLRSALPTGQRETHRAALLNGVPLSSAEAGYVEAAWAVNTLRGYRLDWREFTAWCAEHGGLDPLPAAPPAVTGYLTALAERGAKVGTMSRRLSAIKFAHQLRDLPDPTRNARVVAVRGRACDAPTGRRPSRPPR
jgi:hypothetical protein